MSENLVTKLFQYETNDGIRTVLYKDDRDKTYTLGVAQITYYTEDKRSRKQEVIESYTWDQENN